jgi:hypothetical protein
MERQYNDKWGAINQRVIAPHLSLYCLSISLIYCSSFAIVLSVDHSDLLLLICHCIVCPSLRFTAPHLPLYCLSISTIYCTSFVIVLSVHLSDLLLLICHYIVCPSLWYILLLICHCIVCPSLLFTAPHLSLYCLTIPLIYCSSFVIVLSVRSKSERWTDNTMANEEQ